MIVHAVVVTNGATQYLPQTLAAVATQDRPVDHIVVIDHGPSSGEVAQVCAEAGLPHARVVAAPGAANLGAAVRHWLASGLAPESDGAATDWFWLLHDDSAPQPAALAQLVTAVDLAPSVGIAGCKQVGWTGDPLYSVGVTTSRFGRRLTGIEDGEIDQGQHDHRDDMLAVGTAGMLIRAEVWRALGGPDRELGPFLEGQDLSRRARLAGYRVIVVPLAVVRHARASYAAIRDGADRQERRRAFRRRRQEFVHFQLVAAPLLFVPVIAVIALLAGVLRSVGRVALKEPLMVSAELLAPIGALARPGAIIRGRRQARGAATLSRRVLRPLQLTWRGVLALERDRRQQRAAARRALIVRDELEVAERAQRAAARRFWLTTTLVGAVILAAVVLGPLLTAGQLVGGALARSTASLAQVWQAATSWHVTAELGHAVPADPLVTVLLAPAAVGAAFGLHLGNVITALVLLAVPLAALSAWAAAGAVTRSPAGRAWVALIWAGAPALQLALGQGRLGALLAHIALPLVALGIARGAGVARADTPAQRRPEGSVAAAAGGALALAVVVAGAPVLFPAAVLIVAVCAIAAGRRWARIALMIMPSLVVLGPYLRYAVDRPELLAADPGIPLASEVAPAWQLLLGQPIAGTPWPLLSGIAAEIAPLIAGGVVALLATVGLWRSGGRGVVARIGWLAAALGLATAVISARVAWVGQVTGWAGSGTSLMLLGLLTAALVGLIGIKARLAQRSFGIAQVGAAAITAIAVLVPLAGVGAWAWQVRGGQTPTLVAAASGMTVPAVSADAQQSADRTRSLVLLAKPPGAQTVAENIDAKNVEPQNVEPQNVIAHQLLDRPVPDLLDNAVLTTVAAADAASETRDGVIAALVSGTDATVAQRLAELAVLDVLVLPTDPMPTELIAVLDGTQGLERVTANDYGVLWRVEPGAKQRPARVRVVAANGATIAAVPATPLGASGQLPAGESGRRLVVAHRAAPGWSATVDGVPLRPDIGPDGLQAFNLPSTGGDLELQYEPVERAPWLAGQAIVLALAGLLSLPLRRRRLTERGDS